MMALLGRTLQRANAKPHSIANMQRIEVGQYQLNEMVLLSQRDYRRNLALDGVLRRCLASLLQ